jgi:hypothetical protein
MFKSFKNNMKNWLHMHLPKVTKTALGPLGVKTAEEDNNEFSLWENYTHSKGRRYGVVSAGSRQLKVNFWSELSMEGSFSNV